MITLEAGGKYWGTDDILIQGTEAADRKFSVAIQVKHQCSPTSGDKHFSDYIQRAWDDWNNRTIFDPETDRLILGSSISSRALFRFHPLIKAAQSTVNHVEFLRRLAVPKLIK